MSDYEFIIIGSGAGGGTIASKLARAGRKILILERGGFLPQEAQNWDPEAVFEDGRYISPDTWYDRHGKPFQPQSHYYVGGATKLYGAALFRLRPEDFDVTGHVDGASPAWPVSYGDMEPFYSAAEQMYQVHGRHGEDPTEGAWSRQYPHPPVRHAPRIAEISGQLTAEGYHPFHAPSAVLLNESGSGSKPELPCVKCGTCDGHPCLVNGKADADVIAVKPIVDYPNVTLVTGAEVDEIVVRNGRVMGVWAKQQAQDGVHLGGHDWYSADNVVLAAGAVNTAKILLQSGIANSSGQVGRNFMMHNSRAVIAVDRKPNHTVFQKTMALHDFYGSLGSIQMVGKSCAAAMRGESRLAMLAPEWPLAKIAAHSVDFWLTTEDLPLAQNRVTLDTGGNVHLAYTPTNESEARGLYIKLREIMRVTGMLNHTWFAGKQIPLAGVAHQAGTARMGNDPATSVVDVHCKAHDLDNLYVTDASVFPSIGAVNPALTIMANALRVGQHLLEEN